MHRNSLREKYAKKRKERQDILSSTNRQEGSKDDQSPMAVEGNQKIICLEMFYSNSTLL